MVSGGLEEKQLKRDFRDFGDAKDVARKMQQIQTWRIRTLDWGKAVGGPRQDRGSLLLPFSDGHDPKPIFKHFPREEEKSLYFSAGGDNLPPAHP